VAILGIMAAVVIPSVDSMAAQNLPAAAHALAADLLLARDAAVLYNTEWAAQFDLTANQYTLVQTGPGTAPPLQNVLSGNAAGSAYAVKVSEIGVTSGNNGVKLAAVFLQNSKQNVTDVRFQALGGTGPVRSEDTAIWLTQGSGSGARSLRLTVSWITGQVFVDPPTSGPPR
jgi:Tfp pilus assembly protein FimT